MISFLIKLFIAISLFVCLFLVGEDIGKEESRKTRQKMKAFEEKENK